MCKFKEIPAEELNISPFKLIGKNWGLISAEKNGNVNTMTVSWGGMGVMWGKDVVFAVVRPQRYTKEFIDSSNKFSMTFLGAEFKKTLTYLGTVSGRDEDKIAKSGLTVKFEQNVPYFEEANIVIFCKNLFKQPYNPECFMDDKLKEQWYPEHDYHDLYIAEIEKILVKQ